MTTSKNEAPQDAYIVRSRVEMDQRQYALKLAKEALYGYDDMDELITAAKFILTGRGQYEDPPAPVIRTLTDGYTDPTMLR